MVDRVSTASLHQQNLKDMGRVQLSLATLNRQISSGLKADTFDQMAGIVERVSSYETKLSNIDVYLSNSNSIKARLNTMDQSVSEVQDVATQFASLLALRRNPAASSGLNFVQQASSLLDTVVQSLNVSVEGRYLFGGSKTDTQPIPKPLPSLQESGVPDDKYYNGNNDILTARVSDTHEIPYGVKANDPGFQKLIASIQTAIEADKTGKGDEVFAKAVDLINEAVEELAQTRAGIGANSTNLSSIKDQHDRMKLYWKEAVTDETSTDIAEASIQLTVDQTVLQATFQAFASLSKLKLTDYL